MNTTLFESSPLLIGIIGYLGYFYFLKNARIKQLVVAELPAAKASFYWILLSRVIAFVCVAILPLLYINIFDIYFWEIDFIWTQSDLNYTLILGALLIPLGAINAKGKNHMAIYPQVRMAKWNPIEYILNILSWGLYLLGYEFLFRGILFLGLLPFTGLYPAVFINTLLYALAHLYKGKKETLGSIPLGIILCLITAKTETIWTAFAVHWIMATNNFVWSQYYSSKSKYKKSNLINTTF